MSLILVRILYYSVIVLSFAGVFSSPVALVLGFLFNALLGNPYSQYTSRAVSLLLKICIVGLGFGMYMIDTLRTSRESFLLTTMTILLALGIGMLLGRLLRVDRKLGFLISSGTAICGGSAIAAVAPVIRAEAKTISVALGVVFLLNSIALLIFPVIGEYLQLSETEFGLWCAVAIHDTSSVVGASLGYGDEALRVATTVKLSRALWIIPLTVGAMFYFRVQGEKFKLPYFILLFILAIVVHSYGLIPSSISSGITFFSKRLLLTTLFLVGTSLNLKDIRTIGFRPLILAFALWFFISVFSLWYIIT